jgi:hypothetical protein
MRSRGAKSHSCRYRATGLAIMLGRLHLVFRNRAILTGAGRADLDDSAPGERRNRSSKGVPKRYIPVVFPRG